MKISQVFASLVVLSMFAHCSAIFCYTCTKDQKKCMEGDYLTHEDCEIVMDWTTLVRNISACVTIVEYFPNNTYFVERGCRKGIYAEKNKNETEFCDVYMQDIAKEKRNVTCKNCFDFFCNSAENEHFVRFWLFLTAILVVMFMNQRA